MPGKLKNGLLINFLSIIGYNLIRAGRGIL